MSTHNIVIPEQFYVNYAKRGQKVPLGFATYFENNSLFRKRKGTIDGWADKATAGVEADNVPRPGFKLSEDVTHGGGWNDTSTYWRVSDPSGFELEITSGNVTKLFRYCDISKGVINQPCIWGWDKANGSKPVLIPIESDLYKAAVKTTAVHNAESLALKDMKIGYTVQLKNGDKGVFLGKVFYTYYNDKSGNREGFYSIKQDFTYLIADENGLIMVKAPKIIKVTGKDELSHVAALAKIKVGRKKAYIRMASAYGYRSHCVLDISYEPGINGITTVREDIDIEKQVKLYIKDAVSRGGQREAVGGEYAKTKDGRWYRIERTHSYHSISKGDTAVRFQVDEIAEPDLEKGICFIGEQHSGWNSPTLYSSDIVEMFKIYIDVRGDRISPYL